ncbi:MAG: hypothetical protein ACTMUB_07995 [cyanobacterium endosymbiont of Rhopalodia musculus]|nr:hypothetical protein [cyanobacterium endosymbiont of Epithemia clementina EcSB]WGT68027.1 hypothetical protein P3F56_02800 [cyanobacterium endosymbiont of Epithemia clementina EcSB]
MIIAKVYEGDIHQVKINKPDKMKSENNTVPGELQETVQKIRLQINHKYL